MHDQLHCISKNIAVKDDIFRYYVSTHMYLQPQY